MALFSSASRSVKLLFLADASGLERTLSTTEARLKRFEAVAGRNSKLNSGLFGGISKAGAFTAGLGVAAVGLRSVIKAAEDAQQVQAKLRVSTQNAGISYDQYASQIDKAIQSESRLTGLDDERLSETFANLIRTTKNVGAALNLMSTAADLARTKGLSLEAASSLLARAYNGNFRGLNRLGILIPQVTTAQDALRASTSNATVEQVRAAKAADATATRQQALATLQATFAGQAEAYGKTAVGAQERLGVSLENVQETLGSGVLPLVAQLATALSDSADQASRLVEYLKKVKIPALPGLPGGQFGDAFKKAAKLTFDFAPGAGQSAFFGKQLQKLLPNGGGGKGNKGDGNLAGNAAAFASQFGLPALTAKGQQQQAKPTLGFPSAPSQNQPTTDVPAGLKNKELDARLSRDRNRIKDALAKEAEFLRREILNSVPEDQTALKQALLAVTDEIKSIDDQIIQDARDKKQAIKDAKDAQKRAHQKALDALKQQAQAFKDQADAIKSAVLSKLDSKQQSIDNARALRDAKEKLKYLIQLGAPDQIRTAREGVADAKRAIQRQQIENTQFGVSAGPKGPVSTVTAGSIVFNINGNSDPKVIADAVLARLQKKVRHGTTQQRGTISGRNFNVGIN